MSEINKLFWKMILIGTILSILGLLVLYSYFGSLSLGCGIAMILIALFYKIIWKF